jgi:hypothetical protein
VGQFELWRATHEATRRATKLKLACCQPGNAAKCQKQIV